jgi:hypothetical protein
MGIKAAAYHHADYFFNQVARVSMGSYIKMYLYFHIIPAMIF